MYHGLINSVAKSIEEYCESTVEIVTPTMTVNKPDWEFIGQYRAKQEDAVNTIVEKRFGVLKAVVRFGKTVVVAACVAKLKTSPVAIIVYQQEQLDHFYKIVEEFTNIDNIGIVGDSTVRIGDVTIYMMQSLIAAKSRGDDDYVWSEFKKSKVVFCDECFPAGTTVDGISIENIKIGDLVNSFNHNTNCIEKQKVLNTFKSKPTALIRIVFDDGLYQDCTPTHPFWNGDTYISAINLKSGDMVYTIHHGTYVCRVPKSNINSNKESKRSFSKKLANILCKKLLRQSKSKNFKYINGGNQQEVCIGAYEAKQPNVSIRDTRKSKINTYSNWSQTCNTRWKRTYCTYGTALINCARWLGRKLQCCYQKGSWKRVSDMLQNRHSQSILNDSHRSRWGVTRYPSEERTGQKETNVLRGKRVDRIEIHEQTSCGEFRGLCPGGAVYNIEVEGNNNYFVNGVLVHNCHHTAADGGSEVLDALTNVECLVGVSGTPWREDGRQEFLTALFGDVIFEVGIGTAIEHDLICPITVFVDDVPAKNYGIIDHIRDAADNGVEVNQFHVRRQYQNVYNDYIVNNKTRHKIIADFVDEVRNENLTCAVIVRIKKHADQLKSHIPDSHIVVANTKDRKSQLDALRQREIDCVITTLLDEAVDIPSLDVVILAAGGKSQTKLTQRLRNLTKFEGELSTGHYKKERAYILYLNDDADFLKTHSKTNIKNLKQIVKQHKRNEFIWRNNGI